MVPRAARQRPAVDLVGAGGVAGGFLRAGIERWEKECRVDSTEGISRLLKNSRRNCLEKGVTEIK